MGWCSPPTAGCVRPCSSGAGLELAAVSFLGLVLNFFHFVVQADYGLRQRGGADERLPLGAGEFLLGILLLLLLLLSLPPLLVLSLLIRRHLKAGAYAVLVVVDRFFVTHFCFLCIFTKCNY